MANKKTRPKYGPGPGSGPEPSSGPRPATATPLSDARTEVQTRPAPAPSSATVRPRPTAGSGYSSRPVGRKPSKKSNNMPLLIAAGLIALALAGTLAFLVLGGSKPEVVVPTEGDIPIAPDPAAQVRSFPDQGQGHLSSGQTVQTLLGTGYNSNPPTSGPHLPNWSNWGLFTEKLPDELQIHNLEHGGIIMQYDCTTGCPAAINALSGYARKYPPQNFTGILLAPRQGLPEGARLALTAWGNRLLLKSVDVDKINQFISTFIGKGPEKDPSFRQ